MTKVATSDTQVSKRRMSANAALAIAALICTLEGFDLAVWGASVPLIMQDPAFGLSIGAAGLIGAIISVGMLIGAAVAGAVVHRYGQVRLIAVAVGIFSVGMLMNALAPDPLMFGIGRLVVGLGLGVVLPTVNAYTADISKPGQIARNIGLTMAGYGVGALCAPILAAVLQQHSFRWLYVIGVVPAIILLPFLRWLPESPAHLWRSGRRDEATALALSYGLADPSTQVESRPGRWLGLGALFGHGVARATLLFWVMSFCGLLLVFGISAWLPTILQAADYAISNALYLTAAMWLGVIVGVIVGGRVADIIGAKAMVVIAFLTGTLGLVLMSFSPPEWIMYILMFISGFGFIGSQIMSNALMMTRYPTELRGNGIAWALSIGRIGAIVGPPLGALVLASQLPVEWNFYAFAIPALIGALAAALVPQIIGNRYPKQAPAS